MRRITLTAADLRPGDQATGYLPAVEGLRDVGCRPVVKRARRVGGWIHVTWADGTRCQYDPQAEIDVVGGGESRAEQMRELREAAASADRQARDARDEKTRQLLADAAACLRDAADRRRRR